VVRGGRLASSVTADTQGGAVVTFVSPSHAFSCPLLLPLIVVVSVYLSVCVSCLVWQVSRVERATLGLEEEAPAPEPFDWSWEMQGDD